MTSGRSPAELAELFDEMSAELDTAPDGSIALLKLAELAVRRVDGANYAGITLGRDGEQFRTVAATHDIVHRCDKIQYDLVSGPCVDAVVSNSTYNAGDLRTDPRWPEFGALCVQQTGIISMLSIRLFIESDAEVIAGLNMYSHHPVAFGEHSETVAHMLAVHGSLAVGKATAQAKARNLLRALQNSREIGMAMGIIMATNKITREQAFDMLRVASQHTHRKLADIAIEVTETGEVPKAGCRSVGPPGEGSA